MVFTKDKRLFDRQKKLIEACKNNDRKAQLKLYNQYYKAMYRICLNMVKEQFTAEDLMQEAFISAFARINQFKEEVSIGAWLKKIVINKCIDYLKKKKVQFELIESYANIPEINYNDETFINESKAREIKAEIINLPDGYRTILTLYLLEGYDHEEIAKIIGITSSTSRSQYTRAKALLLKNLKNVK